MPLELAPDPGDPIETRNVAFPEWDITKEWFTIKTYISDKVVRDARTAATRSIREGNGKVREEIDNEAFVYQVVAAQLTDWHFYDKGGVLVPYNDANVRKLRGAAMGFLFDQIMACTGIIPTEQLLVPTESGQLLTYKSTDEILGTEQPEAGVPDPQ